jgi:hypothetical protein
MFRTSLRDWQARWKARQANAQNQPPQTQPAVHAEPEQPRVKRLVAHKRRKQKRLAAAQK